MFPAFQQLRVEYDAASRAAWCFLNPQPRPCMTTKVLQELTTFQRRVHDVVSDPDLCNETPIHYIVGASLHPRYFNLGGDLALFHRLIVERDRVSLAAYAHSCVDVLYANATNLDLPLTTIAVVHGDALGGGFEAVLSCNYIIAERGVRMGFPEILFNLVPGMGAYTLLARRIGISATERMIMSGLNYSAEELQQLGIVDIVVPPGEGQQAARNYIHNNKRQRIATRLLSSFRRRSLPISHAEMRDNTEKWVDAALQLSNTELAIMERLITHQDSGSSVPAKKGQVITMPRGTPEKHETA
ncbi:MAG: crotonase/enoyl-CoA hydratase family protein [Sulfuricaulis sp.]